MREEIRFPKGNPIMVSSFYNGTGTDTAKMRYVEYNKNNKAEREYHVNN